MLKIDVTPCYTLLEKLFSMKLNFDILSDNQLIELYVKKKELKAFEILYRRYFTILCKFVYSRTGNVMLMEDIVSETFMTFMNIIASYNMQSKLSSFLIGIALNKLRVHWNRHPERYEQTLDESIIILDDFHENEERQLDSLRSLLPTILSQLPPLQKKVLELRFLETKSIKETAVILEISSSNVRVTQHRALINALRIAKEL